eukprot:COSAG01_NODE_2073_length_8494_cov_18.692555_4_plen_42_part_00
MFCDADTDTYASEQVGTLLLPGLGTSIGVLAGDMAPSFCLQ